MKIVLAHKYLYRGGGTATYALALLEELEKRGHECIPFTVAYDQTVPRRYWDYYVSPPAGSDTTHLRDMRLSPWQMVKLLGRATWSVEAYRKALRLVDDTKPDIAYVLNLYSYMSPSPIAAFHKRGLPVVMREADYNTLCAELHLFRDGRPCEECIGHGLMSAIRHRCHKGSLTSTAARVWSMWYHRRSQVFRKVDRFVVPSDVMRDTMVRAGYPAEKIHHLRSFYPPVETGPAEGAGDHVLYFGRVAPEKGLDVLIRAMALLETDIPLLIAGSDVDGDKQRLEQLATQLGVRGVQFVGMKQRAELDQLIRDALFTVVPSKWYDNCPMSVLESFSHGKPVIGAAIGGIPEQITADCGLLFEPGNAESLATQMRKLLDDAELRRSMGRAAYQRLCTVYSVDRHVETLLGHFEELLGR